MENTITFVVFAFLKIFFLLSAFLCFNRTYKLINNKFQKLYLGLLAIFWLEQCHSVRGLVCYNVSYCKRYALLLYTNVLMLMWTISVTFRENRKDLLKTNIQFNKWKMMCIKHHAGWIWFSISNSISLTIYISIFVAYNFCERKIQWDCMSHCQCQLHFQYRLAVASDEWSSIQWNNEWTNENLHSENILPLFSEWNLKRENT